MFKKHVSFCDESILNESSTSDPLNTKAAEFTSNSFVKI